MNKAHTPGPWRVHTAAPDRIIVNGSCVYRVRDMTTNEDGQYGRPNPDDVRLMAAAPELLECCQRLLEIVEAEYEEDEHQEDLDTWRAAIQLANDAIAKAQKGA